jgi:hypothetical protein
MDYKILDKSSGALVTTVIHLQEFWATCSICGADTPSNWGIPVNTNGDVVPNNYQGEWGGIPACQPCFKKHEDWSRKIETGQNA